MSKPLTRQIVCGDHDAVLCAVRTFAERHSSFVETTDGLLRARLTVDAVLPFELSATWHFLSSDSTELSVDLALDIGRIRVAMPPWRLWLTLPGMMLCMGAALPAAKGSWLGAAIVGLPGVLLCIIGMVYMLTWSRKLERADKSSKELICSLWSEVRAAAHTLTPISAIEATSMEAKPRLFLFNVLFPATLGALFFLFLGLMYVRNVPLTDESGQLRIRGLTVIAIGVLLVTFWAIPTLAWWFVRAGPFRYHFVVHFCNLIWSWCTVHVAATFFAYLIAFFDVVGSSMPNRITGDVFLLQAMVPILELGGIALWMVQLKKAVDARRFSGPLGDSRKAAERWEEPGQSKHAAVAGSCILLIVAVNAVLFISAIGFAIGATACTWYMIDGRIPKWIPLHAAPITTDGIERFPILTLVAMWSGFVIPAWTLMRKTTYSVDRVHARSVTGTERASAEWTGPLVHIAEIQSKINSELDRFRIRVRPAGAFSPTRVSNSPISGSAYVVWLSVFDALLSPEEVEIILWHEVGHCAYREAQPRWVGWCEHLAWGDAIRWIVSDSVKEELFADRFAVTQMGTSDILDRVLRRCVAEQDGSIFIGPTTMWEGWRWFWSAKSAPYYHPAVETRLAALAPLRDSCAEAARESKSMA